MLLQGGKWIKSPGIHIVKTVFFFKVGKITMELFSAISKASGCRKTRPGADENRGGRFKRSLQRVRPAREGHGRWLRQDL